MDGRMENLNSLNLWMYLQKRYGVLVAYSDTGWRIEYASKVYEGGDVEVGMAKHRLAVRLDPKKMAANRLAIIDQLHGLIPVLIHEDLVLREKLAAMKVEARRKARNG